MMAMTPKKRPTSVVWNYMEMLSPKVVQCKMCKSEFSYNRSTSTLLRHLHAKHPVESRECRESQRIKTEAIPDAESVPTSESNCTPHHPHNIQPKSSEPLDKTKKSSRKYALDNLLVRMICSDMQPLTIVEDSGFRNFVTGLDPKYVLPSLKDISCKLLPTLYRERREILQLRLDNVSSVSISTDIWTSCENKSFITVTAHFINDEWGLESVVLETARMTVSHTGANIAQELKRIFEAWRINEKVACIVTDNASNMIIACTTLQIPHIPCFAHTLNLVIQEAMKNTVFDLRKKVKDIVAYFHHSVKASDELENIQILHGEMALKLKQDVDSRWNSTYYMFQRFIEIHEFVTSALFSFGRHDLLIDDDELQRLKLSIKALEALEMITREISEEKFTPLSKAVPIVRNLKRFLNKLNQSAPSELVNELDRQIDRGFSDLDHKKFQYYAATLLDPRFKKIPFMDRSQIDEIELQLQNLMTEAPQPDSKEAFLTEKLQQFPSLTAETAETSFWSSYDEEVQQTLVSSSRPTTGTAVEFRRYNEEPLLQRNQDPLAWWQEKQVIFPKLHELAKQFMSIPASSVPSERLFSESGELISYRRCALKESLTDIDRILFLNKNI